MEFLTTWDDSRSYSEAEVDRVIARFVRQRPNGWDSLSYAAEILVGLLGPKRGLLIADRWIMGILAEDIQRTLGAGELSVLRWAAFELLNHAQIPTTVIINEANNLAKMFSPQAASLVHVAVNRMIETRETIGAEVSTGALPILPMKAGGTGEEGKRNLPDLDPQAQLALMLLERQRKMGKGGDEGELGWLEVGEEVLVGDFEGVKVGRGVQGVRMVEAVRKNQESQTEDAKELVLF